MEYYIVFVLGSLIIDYLLWLSVRRLFKLQCSKISIAFLQILNIAFNVIYIVIGLKFHSFILFKILINFIITLLVTDSYKFSNLISLYFSSVVLMFSYYGFAKFTTLLFDAIMLQVFNKNLSIIYDLIVIIVLICYIFAVFSLSHFYEKTKNLKSFLKKVSFLAFGKHIEFVGLLDSGNVLYDTKTKLPVILVSVYSLKNYLPINIYKNITINNFNEMGVSHYLKVVTVDNKNFEIPIIKINTATIDDGENKKNINFLCFLWQNPPFLRYF